MRYLFVVLPLIALAACQSKPIEQMSYSETKLLAQQLHKRCADQGVPMGSPEFDACMQQEINREAYGRQANAQYRQRLAAGLAATGQGMQANAAVMSAAPKSVSCTSTPGMNGVVRTRCY